MGRQTGVDPRGPRSDFLIGRRQPAAVFAGLVKPPGTATNRPPAVNDKGLRRTSPQVTARSRQAARRKQDRGRRCGSLTRQSYQIRTRSPGGRYITSPGCTLNASYQASWFRTDQVRYFDGLCTQTQRSEVVLVLDWLAGQSSGTVR
jgi:hypothetical protein